MSAASREVIVLGNPQGLSVEVRPAAGLDLGALVLKGMQLSWSGPRPTGAEDPWIAEFVGGALVTCGMHNVGLPSEGHNLHGRYALTATEQVARLQLSDDGHPVEVVTGVVRDGAITTSRMIEFSEELGLIRVTDNTKNESSEALQAPILYHTNWGGSFLDEGLRVQILSSTQTPRDISTAVRQGTWAEPASVGTFGEVVLEHTSADGITEAALVNTSLGVIVQIRWQGLTRLHQWIDLRDGRGVLGIEPANCSLRGRLPDRDDGTQPMLGPGETRRTSIEIGVAIHA